MKLTELKQGDKAIITDLSKVNHLVQQRLIDMGMIEGAQVVTKRSMPFGGPLFLESHGQNISIRRNEASRIRVEQL
ncbi:FeoA family protein [Chengkuizengella sediminis]|uniref:FeoA family protein n=1 Tax=Chengkuizengella sediminis TaxID=1885917 RepID=UPI001389D563|nr:FeoA family protein [Chengkuizengella sediminis]NDI35214.1 ferrous iron transport protein A [Chengkuizengella sediminis]